jgi:hypothetical protein
MRKFLGFLVVAAVLVFAGSSAFAQSATKFTAEIVLAASSTSFSVSIKNMTGNIPASGDAVAPKVTWASNTFDANGANLAVLIGSTTWVTSKTYADIQCSGIAAGQIVQFYTDNANSTTTYKYAAGISTANATAMAAMSGSTIPTVNAGLPISYTISDSSSMVAGGTNSVTMFNLATDTSPAHAFAYGVYGVLDHLVIAADTTTTSTSYSTIGTNLGLRYGNDATNTFYQYSSTNENYMFFATTLNSAQRGNAYGTDTLTFAVVNQ